MVLAARDALRSFADSSSRKLIVYFVFTVVCLLLDLIQFFKIVANFARLYSAFADLALIVIACLFLFIDWFYIMWIVSLRYKFPTHISTGAIKGFFGIMEALNSKLGEYLKQQKTSYDHAYNTGA